MPAGLANREVQVLADGILAREVPIGERLVDHGDPLRRLDVAFEDAASAQHGNAQRVEQLRVHFVDVGLRAMVRIRRRQAGDRERLRPQSSACG